MRNYYLRIFQCSGPPQKITAPKTSLRFANVEAVQCNVFVMQCNVYTRWRGAFSGATPLLTRGAAALAGLLALATRRSA